MSLLALDITPGPRDPPRFALTSRGSLFPGPCHPSLLRPQAIPRGQKCLDWGFSLGAKTYSGCVWFYRSWSGFCKMLSMLLKPHGGLEFATFRVGFKETLLSEPILTYQGRPLPSLCGVLLDRLQFPVETNQACSRLGRKMREIPHVRIFLAHRKEPM